jgi:uncharacterized protein (TIGR03435 family)
MRSAASRQHLASIQSPSFTRNRVGRFVRGRVAWVLLTVLAMFATANPRIVSAAQALPATPRLEGTTLLAPNAGLSLAFQSITIAPAKDNGGQPFGLAMTQDGLTATHISLRDLIRFAYHAKSYDQIIGGAEWIKTAFYDVNATWPDDSNSNDVIAKLSPQEQQDLPRLLMQNALSDRTQLKIRIQSRTLPVYALVVAEGGSKLKEVQPPQGAPDASPPAGAPVPSLTTSPVGVTATTQTMHTLADFISISDELGGRVVLDETGLKGYYDFVISGVSMQHSQFPSSLSIFPALENQLGLRLELRSAASVQVLIVEHAKRPTV